MFDAEGHLPELVILLLLAVLILGPGKLPSVGGAIGTAIREFRRGLREEPRDATPETPPPGTPHHAGQRRR